MKPFAAPLKPTSIRVHQTSSVYLPLELKTFTKVFVKIDPIKPNLLPAYSEPYPVVSRTKKIFDILENDKVQSVAINNIKPCYILLHPFDIHTYSSILTF